MFGCEPERADDAFRSLKTGVLQTMESSDTISDGLRASLSPRTFAILRNYVDGIVLISEEEIRSAARLVAERMKLIVEPSSSIALSPTVAPGRCASFEHCGTGRRQTTQDWDHFLWRKCGSALKAIKSIA